MPIASKDVTWVEEPEIGFWEATFLPAILAGLKTTVKHVTHYKTVTEQYPEEKPTLPLHYRGVHRLNRDDQGRYYEGITATCAQTDDFTGPLGVATEKLTAAAISYLQTGTCPAVAVAPGRSQVLSVTRGGVRQTSEAGDRQGMWVD